ncbi:hypothetical protein ACJX0J_034197 [Zea mays]
MMVILLMILYIHVFFDTKLIFSVMKLVAIVFLHGHLDLSHCILIYFCLIMKSSLSLSDKQIQIILIAYMEQLANCYIMTKFHLFIHEGIVTTWHYGVKEFILRRPLFALGFHAIIMIVGHIALYLPVQTNADKSTIKIGIHSPNRVALSYVLFFLQEHIRLNI